MGPGDCGLGTPDWNCGLWIERCAIGVRCELCQARGARGGGPMGWGGRGISLINKGVDFDGTVCVLFCVRQDENHALVALAVQIMCYYACALLGAVSVQVALFFSCPWGGVYMTLLWEVGEGSRGS